MSYGQGLFAPSPEELPKKKVDSQGVQLQQVSVVQLVNPETNQSVGTLQLEPQISRMNVRVLFELLQHLTRQGWTVEWTIPNRSFVLSWEPGNVNLRFTGASLTNFTVISRRLGMGRALV